MGFPQIRAQENWGKGAGATNFPRSQFSGWFFGAALAELPADFLAEYQDALQNSVGTCWSLIFDVYDHALSICSSSLAVQELALWSFGLIPNK